jgi:DNA-binding phage protein
MLSVSTEEVVIVQTAKQEVEKMLHHLPEDSTMEDIQYHLYVLEKVRRGMERIDQEGGVSQEDAERRLSRWLIK